MAELRCLMGGAPFADACKIYAPRYRQANVLTFFNIMRLPYVFDRRESGVAAMSLAYSDVRRAFHQFLDEIKPNEPFFLAGYAPPFPFLLQPLFYTAPLLRIQWGKGTALCAWSPLRRGGRARNRDRSEPHARP